MDVWARIPGFPGWVASPLGEIWFAPTRRRARRATPSDSGYERVYVGTRKVRVHRLVLFAFAGPPPSPRHHGAHKNGDKSDNRFDNLVWKTPEENEADKRVHGTSPRGRIKKKISRRTVRKIREAWEIGDSISMIARRHRLHRKTVARHARKP